MNHYLNKCLDMYDNSTDSTLSLSSHIQKHHYVLPFLGSLPDDFISFSSFDSHIVYDYLSGLSYSEATISIIKYVLKDFFNYLYSNDMSSVSGIELFPIIRSHLRLSLLSGYSNEEISCN